MKGLAVTGYGKLSTAEDTEDTEVETRTRDGLAPRVLRDLCGG